MKTTKYLLLLSTATLVSACAMEQKPAPYEERGNQQFTRGSSSFESGRYKNDDVIKSSPIISPSNTYNNNSDFSMNNNDAIDQNEITNQALHEGKAFNNPINNRIGASTTNLLRADYIDGKKDVVKIGSSENSLDAPIKPIITAQNQTQISEGEGFVDMSKLGSQKSVDEKLARVKPLQKPNYELPVEKTEPKPQPVKAAAIEMPAKPEVKKDETPTITPKIQKIETSAGNIAKSTPAMINKTPDATVEDKGSISLPPPVTRLGNQNLVKEADKQVDTIKKDELPSTKPTVVKAEEKKAESQLEKDISEIKPTVDKAAPQFVKPVDGSVILGFGDSKANGKPNDGINISAPEGAPVKAAAGGEVVYSGNQLQGYGNLVIIRHPEGYLTAYSHMQNLDLKKGEKVKQGQVIGRVGTTGNVETPQLHFGVRKGREAVDPKEFL